MGPWILSRVVFHPVGPLWGDVILVLGWGMDRSQPGRTRSQPKRTGDDSGDVSPDGTVGRWDGTSS